MQDMPEAAQTSQNVQTGRKILLAYWTCSDNDEIAMPGAERHNSINDQPHFHPLHFPVHLLAFVGPTM